MALFLAGFLERADLGEGGTDITKVTSDDSLFEDLSGLPRTVETAVYRLYELGVTKGTSDTAFSPDAPVTRGQMASFITRALSHTNARPSGVTVQAVDTKVVEGEQIDVLISLRDRFHRPIADAYVDLFGVDLDAENPFDRDGTCSSSIQNLGGLLGGLACVIDHADLTTDGFGNAVDAVRIDDSLTLWAWTGAIDEEYDEDKAEARTFMVLTSKPPVDLEITDDMKEGASLLAFDDRITFTLQVVDRDGDPVPVRRTLRVASTIEANGVVKDSESRNYSTDSSGSLTFRFQERDPDKSKNDDVVTLDLDVSVSDLVVRDRTTLGASDGGGDVRVTWSQESAVPTMLRIVQKPVFHVASDEGPGRCELGPGGAHRPVRRSGARSEDTVLFAGRSGRRGGPVPPPYQLPGDSHRPVSARLRVFRRGRDRRRGGRHEHRGGSCPPTIGSTAIGPAPAEASTSWNWTRNSTSSSPPTSMPTPMT